MVEWAGARYADTPSVQESVEIAAPVDRVWSLVTDISLMPRFSPELERVEWLDDGPALGARLRGHNRHDALGEWSTTSYIVGFEPQRTLAWAVESPEDPIASWSFTLEQIPGGTRLTQSGQLGPGPSGLSQAIEAMPEKEQKIVFVRLREFEAGIKATLAGIKQLAEQG